MNAETKDTKISTDDLLLINLSAVIKKKHHDILRVTNSRLITLFWQLGKQLNQINASRSLIRNVSNQLLEEYGPYFSLENLNNIARFANQFTDFSNVTKIAPFISWEHILLLLKLKNLEAKLYYIKLTIQQELNVNGLQKCITANMFEESILVEGIKEEGAYLKRELRETKVNAEMFLQIFQLGAEKANENSLMINNVFREPFLSSFRPLIGLTKRSKKEIIKHSKIQGIEKKLHSTLLQHIEDYILAQKTWLSAYLNLSFWEIGKKFNEEILSRVNGSRHHESIFSNASTQLQNKYGKKVSGKQLEEMAEFAKQIAGSTIASRISYLVSWNHILVLLSLQGLEAKLFYAKLTATAGLTVVGLQKQIAKKAYEKTNGAKEIEQNTITALQNSTVTKTKQNVTVSTIYINSDGLNSNLLKPDFLKSPYSLLLM